MIVQCPNCDSRYRVNDANVPASGGKITCPSCQDKFIVYPETPDAPDTQSHSAFEDETSVAKRPDLRQLVDQMSPQHDDVGAETEVMSPLNIPDSLRFKHEEPPEDGTVEMSSPDIANLRAQHAAQVQAEDEDAGDSASTEVLDNDALDQMGFHISSDQQDSPHHGETREHASLRTHLESSSTAERPNLDAAHTSLSSPTRERASLPAPQYAPAKTAPPTRPAPPPRPVSAPVMTPEQPGPTQAPEPQAGGPDATHDGPWKLKTNFGLTYEFSDNASLQNWLSNREDLGGYELAGSADFYPVSAWPQFESKAPAYNPNRTFGMAATPQPASPQGAQPGPPNFATPDRPASGPFDQASATPHPGAATPQTASTGAAGPANWDSASAAQPPRKIIQPTDYRPASSDSKLNWILWPIAGVLFAIGVLLAVQVLGVYDVKSAILGEMPATPAAEGQLAAEDFAAADSPDQAAVDLNASKAATLEVTRAVDRLLEEAERAIENNRLQSASVKLNNAKLLDEERVSIYVLFVQVYTQMGRTEDAEAAQKTLDELRGTVNPAAAEDEDEDKSEDEDSETL